MAKQKYTGANTVHRNTGSAASNDLGRIMKDMREPYNGLFNEASTGRNDNERSNKHNLQTMRPKIPAGNDIRKERIQEGKVYKNDSERVNKQKAGYTDGKKCGTILENIREPHNGLFNEESTGENDKERLNKHNIRPVRAKIPDGNDAGEERIQEGGILAGQRKEEVKKDSPESVGKEDMGDTGDKSLGPIMDDRRELYHGLFDEAYEKSKKAGKDTDGKNQADTKIKEVSGRYHGNIKEVMQILLHQDLVLCMDGKSLFIKKKQSYVPISFSKESEIMYLKMLLRMYDWELNLPEYKTILKELKTEPDIWVENIEKRDGKYDISFCGGHILHRVDGEFDDYMVQGQMHTKRKPFTEGILLFVDACCELDASVQAGSSELFRAYQNYMIEMPGYFMAKQNQFVPFLKKEYGILGGSTGKLRVLKGVCLREDEHFC